MPLDLAQRCAWSLAQSLLVPIVLFEVPDGYGVMPSQEFDGDPDVIVHEYDPFAA